jgi:hypothetical protein
MSTKNNDKSTSFKEFFMKNTFKFLGIIGLMLVIALSMAACDDGSGGPGGPGGPGGSNPGGSGGLTITDIPSKYNGMLANVGSLSPTNGSSAGNHWAKTREDPPISNGRVTIPLYTGNGFEKYTGNDLLNFALRIQDPASLEDICGVEFYPGVQFHNGSATVSYNEGLVHWYKW